MKHGRIKVMGLVVGIFLLVAGCMTPAMYSRMSEVDYSSTTYIKNISILCPDGVREFTPISGKVICREVK